MTIIRRAPCLCVLVAAQMFSQTAQPGQAAQPAPTQSPAQGKAVAPPAAPAATPSPYLRQPTVSESEGAVHITANSPRPLAQVLDALRQKYKWVVSYEDPQFTAAQDLTTAPGNGDERIQLPNGGSFSVDFPATNPDEEKTVRAVVDAYNHSKNPGRFELRRIPQGDFYVVGIGANDDKGRISSQQVVFDTPITIAAEDKSIAETLNAICQQISSQAHVQVTVGVSPRSLLEHTNVKIGGKALPARDLLVQALAAIHKTVYWHLLFDPNSKGYYLDIHSAHF